MIVEDAYLHPGWQFLAKRACFKEQHSSKEPDKKRHMRSIIPKKEDEKDSDKLGEEIAATPDE